MNENIGEIILYQPDNNIRLEVRMQEETVWLTQAQMGQLFDCSTDNISLHLKNLYAEGEIEFEATSEEISVVRQEGKRQVVRSILHYNLDAILSVDLERHNEQYPSVEVQTCGRFHDRFLIIDDAVYHLGASLKDLGKKLFAFNRMGAAADDILRFANEIYD